MKPAHNCRPAANLALLLLIVPILAAAILTSGSQLLADQPVWKPLADGTTINGWHKNGLGDWTVEDGAFVGRSNKERLYGHLVTDQSFQDFTVRFQFQCTSGDSGFFIRTEMKEPDKTYGLQIQVGPCGSGTGGIYESYGRGWLQKPTKEQETFCYREGRWNDMIISAHGPRVTVHLNGFKTADLNDEKVKQEAGVLALQMHSGVENHTMFRNVATLQQGSIVPRAFLYDEVSPVKQKGNGSLEAPAAAAMNTGATSSYLPDRGTMQLVSGDDQMYWPIELHQAGTYVVSLKCFSQAGGQQIELACNDQRLSVSAAKASAAAKPMLVGPMMLAAGKHRITLKVVTSGDDHEAVWVQQLQLMPTE